MDFSMDCYLELDSDCYLARPLDQVGQHLERYNSRRYQRADQESVPTGLDIYDDPHHPWKATAGLLLEPPMTVQLE